MHLHVSSRLWQICARLTSRCVVAKGQGYFTTYPLLLSPGHHCSPNYRHSCPHHRYRHLCYRHCRRHSYEVLSYLSSEGPTPRQRRCKPRASEEWGSTPGGPPRNLFATGVVHNKREAKCRLVVTCSYSCKELCRCFRAAWAPRYRAISPSLLVTYP